MRTVLEWHHGKWVQGKDTELGSANFMHLVNLKKKTQNKRKQKKEKVRAGQRRQRPAISAKLQCALVCVNLRVCVCGEA